MKRKKKKKERTRSRFTNPRCENKNRNIFTFNRLIRRDPSLIEQRGCCAVDVATCFSPSNDRTGRLEQDSMNEWLVSWWTKGWMGGRIERNETRG